MPSSGPESATPATARGPFHQKTRQREEKPNWKLRLFRALLRLRFHLLGRHDVLDSYLRPNFQIARYFGICIARDFPTVLSFLHRNHALVYFPILARRLDRSWRSRLRPYRRTQKPPCADKAA